MDIEGRKNFVTAAAGTLTGAATLILREGPNIMEHVGPRLEEVGATTMWVLVVGVLGGLAGRGVYSLLRRK